MWEQAQTLPRWDGSAATLQLSLQLDGRSRLRREELAPGCNPDPSFFTPKPQVGVFLQWFLCRQASLCCQNNVLPHLFTSLLCGALVFALSNCGVCLGREGFALTHSAFTCTHATLLIHPCLWCYVPLKIYYLHVVELSREAVVRHFTTHPWDVSKAWEALLLSGFGATLGSLCYFRWFFIYCGNPILELTRCFSSLWDFQEKLYYLFLNQMSFLQLWFHSLPN